MELQLKKEQRACRFAAIRQSLARNTAILATGARLEETMKNKMKKSIVRIDDTDLPSDSDQSEQDLAPQSETLFQQKYEIMEKIGEGAHGVVHRCIDRQNKEECAVKTLALEKEHILHLRTNFMDIKGLKHPNILVFKALFLEQQHHKCRLVTDYLPFPNLSEYEITSEEELKFVVNQLLKTLSFLHSHKICHRDIKPENILYHPDSKAVKLVDFDISRKLEKRGRIRDLLTITGTPLFRAPQMFEGGGYDQMVDVWALGVTIFKLMTGFTPFESQYLIDTIHNIINQEVVFPDKLKFPCSQAPKQLVKRLLKKSKEERLTADEALKDVWFLSLWEDQWDELNRSLTTSNPSSYLQQSSPLILTLTQYPIKSKGKDSSKTCSILDSSTKLFQQPERTIFGLQEVQK